MELGLTILAILITILFVIGTHEFAHFMAARLCGVKVQRFSIGFGKTLWHWYDKKGTEYVIALIPLGGYVKMLDDGEGKITEAEKQYSYNAKPFYKKCIIILAGPAMNLFCALVLYWIVFVIGFTTIKPIIGEVTPDSIAAQAGVKPRQVITSIDHTTTDSWTGIVFRLIAHAGDKDIVDLGTQELNNPQKQNQYALNLANWSFDPLKPDLLGSIGITPYYPKLPLVIGLIGPESPAATSPLRLGDKVIAINHKHMRDWEQVVTTLENLPGQTVEFTVERHHHQQSFPVSIGERHTLTWQKLGFLGIGPKVDIPKDMLQTVQYSPLTAIAHAWDEVWDFSYFNLVMFAKMFTGKLSIKSLGGPITIFESAGSAMNGGTVVFLSFLAFLSLSVGIINLFPIPGLDGGHILIHGIEVIIRRPLPERALVFIFRLGMIFILFILIQALVNDVLRLY